MFQVVLFLYVLFLYVAIDAGKELTMLRDKVASEMQTMTSQGLEVQRNADDDNLQKKNVVIEDHHDVDEQDQVMNDVANQEQDFYVRDYVRAPNSSRSCCYRQCTNENLRRIPTSMKVYLVCNYRLYIPPSARLCQDHLRSTNIDEVLDNINVTNYFNSSFFFGHDEHVGSH